MVIPFSEAISLSGEEPKSLMLGNGFSIEANKIFRYENLYDKSRLDQSLKNLFMMSKTCDFEVIISELEHTKEVLEVYNSESQDLISRLIKDSRELRRIFAQAIINHHAVHQTIFNIVEGSKLRRRSCRDFLSHFTKVFTTNYDLLLYWEIMNEKERADQIFSLDDGFGYVDSNLIWLEPYKHSDRKQNIFYLHGALFFSPNNIGLVKETKNIHSLLEEVQKNITSQNQLPLIVLEGSKESKFTKINNHPYLKNSYDELSLLSGNLFIFGHSLKEFDGHILNAIKDSHVKKVFISFHSSETRELKDIADKAFKNGINGEKEVYLYEANSAHVWI